MQFFFFIIDWINNNNKKKNTQKRKKNEEKESDILKSFISITRERKREIKIIITTKQEKWLKQEFSLKIQVIFAMHQQKFSYCMSY